MSKTFLYCEYQISKDFGELDIAAINPAMKEFPGLVSKTWLSGVNTKSVGGFYEFDTKENAQNYVDNYLMPFVTAFDANITIKLFDGDIVADASIGMNSPYY